MKRPQPDIGDTLRQGFIANVGTVRKLLRLWGTTTIDGVEVFTPRQYYWKEADKSEKFEKLFKYLGMYNDVKDGQYDGLERAWVYFNKNKTSFLSGDVTDFVADNLNRMWWDEDDGVMPEGLTLTTSVVISTKDVASEDRARLSEIINVNMTKAESAASIAANYEELWDMAAITQEGVGVINKGSISDPATQTSFPDEDDLSPDDPWLNTVARYALRDNGILCTVKDVSIGTISNSIRGLNSLVLYSTTFVVDLEIPYNEFTVGELFVQSVAADLAATYKNDSKSNGFLTQKVVKSMNSADLSEDPELVTRTYLLWEDEAAEAEGRYDSLWVKVGDRWYLKAEAFKNPKAYGFKYKELSSYLVSLLDTDHQKKKVPFWKKALAVVLFIIAVILSPFDGGTSLMIVKAAVAILFASMVLTLVTLTLAVTGQQEWAMAFMAAQKFLEPLVMVATVINIFASIQVAAQEAAKTIALEAGKDVAEVTVTEIIVELVTSSIETTADKIVTEITKGATDVMAGNFATNAALSFTSKLVELLTLPTKLKIKSIESKNKDLKAEYDKLTEESDREYDAMQGFMNIYAKPATADWSLYASQFDQPYERGGGPLALGNIQRTTKQALRKADYKDTAFDSILII